MSDAAKHSGSVSEWGEEALVARLVSKIPPSREVIAGPGDDCAVVRSAEGIWQLFKTDCLVEGVHFLPGTDPLWVGRKAMNRVLSDIAAMGGRPDHAVISLIVDAERPVAEIEGWYDGILEAASAFACHLVGGETARLPHPGAVLSIAMTGRVAPEHCVFRHGASPGDRLAVTGRLGGSFESGRHLRFTPRLREAQWLVENARPSAMMDLSDGLGSDLPRLAAASGCGYRVDLSRLPCHPGIAAEEAATEGEDYELLLALPPSLAADLEPRWKAAFPDLPLTFIGEMVEGRGDALPRAWEHYRDA